LRLELREGGGSREGLASITSRQGRYRLGHLLNHHIGGPGNDWRNLTPISPSANTTHYYAVENRLKTLVNTHQRWVYYSVTADYDGAAPAGGANVHPFERQFARRLRWSYQLKKPRANAPTQLENDSAAVAGIDASDSGSVPNISAGYPD
jgi:hypothetical protein